MPLVEIICGEKTDDRALACALDLVGQLRKVPIVVNDSPGFFTSRVFGAFCDEGMAMLAEGVAPALIESAARMIGMPVGPLAVSDEVSLALHLQVHRQALADGLAAKFQRLTALPVLKTMVETLGRPGRRGGGGFYEYSPDGKKWLWPGLKLHFPVRSEQPAVEELERRLLFIQCMESARCVEEGVISHAADADLGSIIGIGFPSWTGGTLSYIDTLGINAFVSASRLLAAQNGDRFKPSPWLEDRAQSDVSFYPATLQRAS
jgi:3-hydroxyacyl-CoA dehydrogenase/enoyl-CoA hydratase/3-hydroxybutyryl-CoA epimerase